MQDGAARKQNRRLRPSSEAELYVNSPATFAAARELAQKGISISSSVNSELALPWSFSGKGRPPSNVFSVELVKAGVVSKSDTVSIAAKRRELLSRHDDWVRWQQDHPKDESKLASCDRKEMGKQDWTVHFAAELAWGLMGRRLPEKIENRHWTVARTARFVDETTALWRFLNEDIERNRLLRRGPRPSAEKLFKASVSLVVARKLILPSGGNSKVIPTATHVSQVWFVLFGEFEPHDRIKKQLPRLAQYLYDFGLHKAAAPGVEFSYYRKLVDPIKFHYPGTVR